MKRFSSFPAIPASWQEVSFRQLRAMGAFLVDAVRREGKTVRIEILAEKEENCVWSILLPEDIK